MKRLMLIVYTLFFPGLLQSQITWFEQEFNRGDLSRDWSAASPEWRLEDGALRISTALYDQLISSSCYVYNTRPFAFEATLRGLRAGVYFSLDSRSSKAISQMVRFDEKSILAGYFDAAGEFAATSVFDAPKTPSDWTLLRIEIDPAKRSYKVFVDGAFVGIDTNLVFSSGYIGLQASDGVSEFESIRVFADGPPKIPMLPKTGAKVSFAHIAFVQARGSDLIVYEPELRAMMRIDARGTLLSAESASTPPKPPTSVIIDGKTFSISGNRILISNSEGTVVDSIYERLVSPVSLASRSKALFVADPGAKVVFQFAPDGRLRKTIDAAAIGGFKAPRGVTPFGESELVIGDYDKLVFWNEAASKPPSVTQGTSATASRIEWTTNAPGPAWLEVAADGAPWVRHFPQAVGQSIHPNVQLSGLSPLTRYSFRYSPALKTIPESFSVSRNFRFTTPASDPNMMSFTRLPVMCMVYRGISYRDKYPRERFLQIPDGRILTNDDISYLKQATEFNREFYFRNSGCKLVLDFDLYVVEDTLWLHEVGESDPYWLSPNDRVAQDFEKAARSFGKNPEDYAGLICPYAWMNYPPRRASALRDPSKKDSITIRQAVGGGTYGVPAPWKYGKTAGYTSNPFQDRFSRQDWLITHEFHHQIDALMEASGYPEYYHADQPWKMPGRFGEDFDFNAQIIRNAEKASWLNMRFGKLALTLDADHDGVPDNDPALPFDENRLRGNPASRDTDGDGVSDLDEVMTGSSRSSAIHNQDTDGDGLPDDIDPEPLYPIKPTIAKAKTPNELESHPFGTIHSIAINATFSIAWTDSALLLSCLTDKAANLLFQIDADNDGWFHGFDNFQICVLNNGDSVNVADYYLRDCSSWAAPPKDRRDILQKSDLGLSSTIINGTQDKPKRHRVVLRVPRNDRYGIRLERGKRFSIRLGVQSSTDLWVWEELYERNYMMQVELQ